MKPMMNLLLASTVALGGVVAAGYAIAERAGTSLVIYSVHAEPSTSPVDEGNLFTEAEATTTSASSGRCLPADKVLDILAVDAARFGGETFALTDGMQQEFSDRWRRSVGAETVPVSLVVAHVVPSPEGDTVVDVVEIGGDGCALSRTLLAGEDWDDLLRSARGIDV